MSIGKTSLNIEIYNQDLAKRLMRRKWEQGLDTYLDFLERAAGILGGARVRSMLMVGLEPMDDTLAGVRAIAERGAVPVLSPFRPDPSTPLRDMRPPTADAMEETYLRARDVCSDVGVPLGPGCVPCTHNTLTFAAAGAGDAAWAHGTPNTV